MAPDCMAAMPAPSAKRVRSSAAFASYKGSTRCGRDVVQVLDLGDAAWAFIQPNPLASVRASTKQPSTSSIPSADSQLFPA